MRVFISKYALTRGIIETDADPYSDGDIRVFEVGFGSTYFHHPDWHESWESAKRRAEAMRDKRIAALEKQLKALTALKFDQPPTIEHETQTPAQT